MRDKYPLRRCASRLRTRSRHALPAIALVFVCVLATGCGGGSAHVASITQSTSTGVSALAGTPSASAPYTNAVNYARCMRRHGEPDFPDPNNPGGFSTAALARLDTASRQFISADSTCRRLLPNNGQPTPAELQQTITYGLKFAHCMRAHHVQFPDPGISGSQITIDLGEVDTNSPQYTAAARICRTKPGS